MLLRDQHALGAVHPCAFIAFHHSDPRMDPHIYIPHREVLPLRRCADCGTLLSSANETARCWQHGGWVKLDHDWFGRADAFADLMAELAAA